MFYAIIHRPKIDTNKIKEVSRKYDPHFGLVDPHVTLVFPFKSEGLDREGLIAHLRQVVNDTKSFNVRLNELGLAWDQWLFLIPSLGNLEFRELHDRLYDGLLASFLRSDIEYVPHLALGHFAAPGSEYDLKDPTAVPLDAAKYDAGRAEIESYHFDFGYVADDIDLISIDDDFTKTEILETFKFSD